VEGVVIGIVQDRAAELWPERPQPVKSAAEL